MSDRQAASFIIAELSHGSRVEHHPLDAVAAGWRSIIILRME